VRGRPGPLFLGSALAALVAVGWLFARQAPLRAGLELDAQHHIAAVRELARGEFPPRHNLVAGHQPQGHYGPYLVALGAVARATAASPMVVLQVAGLANLALFVFLASLAAERLAGEGAGRWAGLATLLLWGPWPRPAWTWPSRGWPGSTSIADVQNFFYPQQAGLVLLLLVLLLVLRRGPEPASPRRWAGVLAASAMLITTHPLTGLALVPMLLALALSDALRHEGTPGRIGALLLLPGAALLLASLWPYYPVLGLLEAATLPGLRTDPLPEVAPGALPAASTELSAPSPWIALPLLEILGPALVGILGFVWLARSRRPFLVSWFCANLLLASLPLLPLRHRFVFFAALPLQLAACGVLQRAWRASLVPRALAIALLLAGAVSAAQRIHWLIGREVPDLSFVARLTPEDAVILSDQATSNGIAGLAGRKVVAPHNPDVLLVAAGGWQRVLDVRRFLSRDATPEERSAIIRRWSVTHVLVDRLRAGAPDLPYPVMLDQAGYRLYAVAPRLR
jgi:hypothetical protein